jgi:hypothetical protein
MQLIAGLIFIGILILLIGAAIYFARSQKPRSQHYGSWSNVLGPQFRGSAMDVGERLNEEIAKGQHQAGHRQSKHQRQADHKRGKRG